MNDDRALKVFRIRPRGVKEAMARALLREDRAYAMTRWSDALSSGKPAHRFGGQQLGSRIIDTRCAHVPVGPEQAFAPVRQIGGQHGWYYGHLLWRIRGAIDLICGGPGMRRGRRNPEDCSPGDALDFWRVEAYERPKLLRLHAEMRLPGRAWLQFEVTEQDDGSTIRQTAIFDPAGLGGLLYWYVLWPIHRVMFTGMLRQIARRAMQTESTAEPPLAGRVTNELSAEKQ